MNYKIRIVNEHNGTVEVFEGAEVNDVLQKVSQKAFELEHGMSFHADSAKRRIVNETKKRVANTTTSHMVEAIDKKKRILEQYDKCKIDLWKILDDKIVRSFNESQPTLDELPPEPRYESVQSPPIKNNHIGKTFLDLLFSKKYSRKLLMMDEVFKKDYETWNNRKMIIDKKNNELKEIYKQEKEKIENGNKEKIYNWNKRKESFYLNLESEITGLEKLKTGYKGKENQAIEKYNYELLKRKAEPLDFWDTKVFVFFNENNNTLYIEYYLPATTDIDAIKEIKYNQAKDLFNEIKMKQNEYEKYYDDVIYQVAIFILYMVCLNDDCNCIEAIAFNGYVKSIDKSTGTDIEPCIISLFVKKVEILQLNLKQVDAHLCFRNLKGVGSSILASQTAIPPIIVFDKSDKRFIQSKEITNTLSDGLNLAAMDWEDFEHLVREVFEKEFSINGGEVKVTRASRDGGVDAIAFDPDPIRGGKIVIQAKRYTNTVGVSAVRDLYGTVMNEGATKGILVSTADYGPDAYEFAKGKPLTLLNGSNLLHLLEKHGHHAKIDLREAKKILSEKEKEHLVHLTRNEPREK